MLTLLRCLVLYVTKTHILRYVTFSHCKVTNLGHIGGCVCATTVLSNHLHALYNKICFLSSSFRKQICFPLIEFHLPVSLTSVYNNGHYCPILNSHFIPKSSILKQQKNVLDEILSVCENFALRSFKTTSKVPSVLNLPSHGLTNMTLQHWTFSPRLQFDFVPQDENSSYLYDSSITFSDYQTCGY